jgi:hypothetical protein
MACSVFDPKIPHSNPDEEAVWIAGFLQKAKDVCAHTCETVCQTGNDEKCGECLKQACKDKINNKCFDCLENANSIDDIIHCTVKENSHLMSTELLVGIIVGTVFVTLIICLTLYFAFKKHKDNKIKNKNNKVV